MKLFDYYKRFKALKNELKSKKKNNIKSFFGYHILDLIEVGPIAFLVAYTIKVFIIQVSVVPTGSMIPTLIGGVPGQMNDRLLVNKFIYDFKDPKRGDIIVFKSPNGDGKDYVKRCVGLPNDKIEIKQGIIYINDKGLILTGVDVQRDKHDYRKVITVPDNHYYVVGDNRQFSSDSRDWGFVPRKNIQGQALFTFWPFSRMRLLR